MKWDARMVLEANMELESVWFQAYRTWDVGYKRANIDAASITA